MPAANCQATFESCGDFLHCAGAIFLPCLTWTMEDETNDGYVPTIGVTGWGIPASSLVTWCILSYFIIF